jgi:hypothetical protein
MKDRRKEKVKERRGRRCKQILDDLKETRGYWKFKEETLWRNRFGKGYVLVVRKTKENENSVIRPIGKFPRELQNLSTQS